MFKKLALNILIVLVILTAGCNASSDPARVNKIHAQALTIDSHVDIPTSVVDIYATDELDLRGDTKLQCDLYKMKQGGLDAVFLAAFNRQHERTEETYETAWNEAIGRLNAVDRLLAACPDQCALATSPAQLRQIVADDKIAIINCVENGFAIGKDLGKIDTFYDRGVRYITLSHIGNNDICDSSMPKEEIGDDGFEHHGLSEFGKKVVARMNQLGIICDVSHISDEAFYDVLNMSKAPIIASHSGCYAITPHARNLKDDMMKDLAKKGGVLQVVNLAAYILPKDGIPADINDFVDHIDHAVKIMGVDYVGIGSDFDGGGGVPGFENHSQCPSVTAELIKRGYCQQDIEKIWGLNILRVWQQVEDAARQYLYMYRKNP